MTYAIINPNKEKELLEAVGKFYAIDGVDDVFTIEELKDLFFPDDVVWTTDLDEAYAIADKLKDEQGHTIFLWQAPLEEEFDIFTHYLIINNWEDYIMTQRAME